MFIKNIPRSMNEKKASNTAPKNDKKYHNGEVNLPN